MLENAREKKSPFNQLGLVSSNVSNLPQYCSNLLKLRHTSDSTVRQPLGGKNDIAEPCCAGGRYV